MIAAIKRFFRDRPRRSCGLGDHPSVRFQRGSITGRTEYICTRCKHLVMGGEVWLYSTPITNPEEAP